MVKKSREMGIGRGKACSAFGRDYIFIQDFSRET
jgi:hypothetical protein